MLAKEFGFIAKWRRLRCCGHIINLVVRQILFGKDPDAFEDEEAQAKELITEHLLWRSRGLLKSSSWTADAMLERALKPEVRKAIDALVLDEVRNWGEYERRRIKNGTRDAKMRRKPTIINDFLTSDDWATLTAYYYILKPFHEVTKRLEGNPIDGELGALWEVLPVMEFLLEYLEGVKQNVARFPDEYFRVNVNLGWAKLDEYYKLLDDSPVYAASIALHPAFGWEWIEH
ncbi:putative transposase [Macrophomina phaseolina MS6]|uniref:Putative transposase n=1 Tax=Macrophomina phaseolina (strain MS6) TaxID=1126212 RepID=K2RV07_MACPH|nr:putative transposase [Macrophomina phaseolina MS6]